jgi:hypothetical protein
LRIRCLEIEECKTAQRGNRAHELVFQIFSSQKARAVAEIDVAEEEKKRCGRREDGRVMEEDAERKILTFPDVNA